MDTLPTTLEGLAMLLTGGAAWLLAGWINKWLGPVLPTEEAGRVKALVSMGVMVLVAIGGYFLLLAIQQAPASEEGFMTFLVGSFAAQKLAFMLTDSVLNVRGLGDPPNRAERDRQVLDEAERHA